MSQNSVAEETQKTPAARETKAQKTERLKLEKNPWGAWAEVQQFAREGREAVLPEWANMYFKWWGIYTQGDGIGAVGGVGGEGKATEYFMMRIGIPNGILTSSQLHTIADLTLKHGRNLVDITTRQNLQWHWLTIESLPEIVETLSAIGLSPKGACGDVVRNVTGCPLAGIHGQELIDASPLAKEIAEKLTANPEFYNLPRKFKISATGCPEWCSYPEINDIGLTAVERVVNGQREVGYSLRVGGGLSAEPHLAVRLDAFIQPERAYDVVKAVTEIFREQDALRENRKNARLKYLFLRHGWTAERFLEALEAKLGYKFDPAPAEVVPDDVFRDHVGIHPQKQAGLSYVGASVLRGRLSGDQLHALAGLAEKYGSGELRATVMQNILIINVPREKAQELAQEIEKLDLQVDGSVFWRGAIACTGTEFCKLAISETKGFTKWLVSELEERLPGFEQQVKINVTGCPNSCGQHWIADIGLEGKKIKKDGKMVDAFFFCVGGAVGRHQATARPTGYRAAAEDVPDAIERLMRGYIAERQSDESIRGYFARQSVDTLRTLLAGEAVAAVERDLPKGPIPSSVAG
jgi:sulfite reductase (ferredoxin)